MGRGRAKAKQTKVARELKYSSPTTDFRSLQQELSGFSPGDDSTAEHPEWNDMYESGDAWRHA
jgi:hypothetical protein